MLSAPFSIFLLHFGGMAVYFWSNDWVVLCLCQYASPYPNWHSVSIPLFLHWAWPAIPCPIYFQTVTHPIERPAGLPVISSSLTISSKHWEYPSIQHNSRHVQSRRRITWLVLLIDFVKFKLKLGLFSSKKIHQHKKTVHHFILDLNMNLKIRSGLNMISSL